LGLTVEVDYWNESLSIYRSFLWSDDKIDPFYDDFFLIELISGEVIFLELLETSVILYKG